VRGLFVLACLTACRPSGPTPSFDLRIAIPGSLDAVTPSINAESWTLLANQLVFEPLIALSSRGDILPVVAARAQLLPSKSLRIWLRADASFSDGAQVTADDVVQSLAGSRLRTTKEDGSLLIESDDPATPVDLQLSITSVYRRVRGKVLGTGGYVLAEQDQDHIKLRRRSPSPRHVGSISLLAYKTPQDAFAHTLKGDADMLPDVDPRWVEFFEGVPRLRVLRTPSPYANVVAFNLNRLGREERIALVRLMRNDQVRKLAFGDDCIPPESRPGVEPAATPTGPRLDVLAVPIFERFGLAVRRVLGDRGGVVRVQDQTGYFSALAARDFDLVTARPMIWPPIMGVLRWHTGAETNVLGYSNSLVDAALDAHDWNAAQRALDDDPPAAFICKPSAVTVLDSRLKNVPTSRVFASIAQWEVQQ
jgi:hypothetical protein